MSTPLPEPAQAARAPSALKAAWLIACLEGRRWLNRRPLRRNKLPGRSGTARKGAPAKLLLALVSLVLAFNVVTQTTRLVRTIALAVEHDARPDTVLVSGDTLAMLDAVLDGTRPVGTVWRSQEELLRPVFEHAARDGQSFLGEAERRARALEITQVFARRGRAGFAESMIPQEAWPSTALWFRGEQPRAMLDPLAIACLFLTFSIVAFCVVGSDRDLARSDATLAWLFTFPVPTRALLLARLLGNALMSPLVWLVLWPFFTVVFWCAGMGPWLGAAMAFAATLYLCLLAASARIACETTLQRWLAPRRIARLQAGLEVLAALPFLLLLAASSPAGARYLVEHAHIVPSWLTYGPLTLPLAWLLPEPHATVATCVAVALGLASVFGAVALGAHMLRDGLHVADEPVVGTRGHTSIDGGGSRSLLAVVARRELLALVRDPGRVARVLIVPLGMIGLFALTDQAIFQAIVSRPEHASATAFSVGIVVLSGGGLVSLANEGPGLWLLYAAPHALDRILMCRAMLWSAMASAICALVLLALAVIAHDPRFLFGGHALLALLGVSIYGFVSVSLGALGTDVLESARLRRLQPYVSQLFLLLSGMFTFALYSSSAWIEFVQVLLSSLFAFALWQKLRDHAPYFLDPTEAPPPRISVSDGIFAAQAFFVLQGLLGILLLKLRVSEGVALVWSFTAAGLVTAAGALYALVRMGIPNVMEELGLWATAARPARALLLGAAAGALAGSCALLYQRALASYEWLRHATGMDERSLPSSEQLRWIGVLAVLAAPVFEEFIFRGLLYRGLRRSLRPTGAALASAAIFAAIHPPAAFAPVFVMALLAAAVFERTQLLLAPVLVHMTYNAMLVFFALNEL